MVAAKQQADSRARSEARKNEPAMKVKSVGTLKNFWI